MALVTILIALAALQQPQPTLMLQEAHHQNFGSFPNYSDPVAAGPAVHTREDCSVRLFHNVGLAHFGQIETAEYSPPTGSCAGPWSAVALHFHGRVSGVQFDRYGALWLGGVELLRTTTPEPSPAGIEWLVERDLTAYCQIFFGSIAAWLILRRPILSQDWKQNLNGSANPLTPKFS